MPIVATDSVRLENAPKFANKSQYVCRSLIPCVWATSAYEKARLLDPDKLWMYAEDGDVNDVRGRGLVEIVPRYEGIPEKIYGPDS